MKIKQIIAVAMFVIMLQATGISVSAKDITSLSVSVNYKKVPNNPQIVKLAKEVTKSLSSSLTNESLSIKVICEGNSLVYVYKYLIQVPDVKSAKKALESALKGFDSFYKETLKAMKTEIKSLESIKIRYVNKDGKVICSKEYK